MLEDVLTEWDIPPSKVAAVITDNGSNMVAAFNSFKVNLDRDEAENDEEEGDDSGELCTLEEAEDFWIGN